MNTLLGGAALVAIVVGVFSGAFGFIRFIKLVDRQLDEIHDNTCALKTLTAKIDPLHEMVEKHEELLKEIEPVVFPGLRRGPRGRTGHQGRPGIQGPQGDPA